MLFFVELKAGKDELLKKKNLTNDVPMKLKTEGSPHILVLVNILIL